MGILSPLRKRFGQKAEYKQLALLRQGEYFGELALINYKPRAASAVCREETHLAVLERNDYFRVLGRTHNDSLQSKLTLLFSMPVFAHWTKTAVQSLSYFLRERSYKRGQALFRHGEAVKEIFIVTKGEFQLTKEVKNSAHHFQVDVTLITSGELIGGEEALRNLPFPYSCLCHSTQGEVFYMAKEDFLGRMNSEVTISYLRSINRAKEEYRLERVMKMTELAGKEKDGGFQKQGKTEKFDLSLHTQVIKEVLMRDKANKCFLPGLYIPTGREEKLPLGNVPVSRQKSRSGLKHYQSASSTFPIPKGLGDSRDIGTRSGPIKNEKKKNWGDILERKYPLEKAKIIEHRRQQSVVNFHRQYLRDLASTLDLHSLRPSDLPCPSRQSMGVSRINISLEMSEFEKRPKEE